MALITCQLFSPCLGSNTSVYVFIPTISADEVMNKKDASFFKKGARYQVLYLLHGAYSDYSDWVRCTNIERYAHDRKLAVVMPSAENSFYQDMYHGGRYLSYVTEELPYFMQTVFPISGKREHTFAAGLSMGGYGALKAAFTKPENYAACASLSGAIDILAVKKLISGTDEIVSPFKWDIIFEKPDQIEGSDADLFALIEKQKKAGKNLPKVFQSCGTEDFIYPSNVDARKRLLELGVDLTYEEHPGVHEWNYWDKHIQRALDWLPLAGTSVPE